MAISFRTTQYIQNERDWCIQQRERWPDWQSLTVESRRWSLCWVYWPDFQHCCWQHRCPCHCCCCQGSKCLACCRPSHTHTNTKVLVGCLWSFVYMYRVWRLGQTSNISPDVAIKAVQFAVNLKATFLWQRNQDAAHSCSQQQVLCATFRRGIFSASSWAYQINSCRRCISDNFKIL